LIKKKIPIDQVKGGTKVGNVVSHAEKAFHSGEHRSVVWSGSGGGVSKTISCAEIMKRNFPLHQVTRLNYQKSVDFVFLAAGLIN
jgi:ribonuclease P/MRP protein subunit RPP25